LLFFLFLWQNFSCLLKNMMLFFFQVMMNAITRFLFKPYLNPCRRGLAADKFILYLMVELFNQAIQQRNLKNASS